MKEPELTDRGVVEEEEQEPTSRRAVNLAFELNTLQDAVGASRILADSLMAGTLDDDDEARRALAGISSILCLVGCRLRDVGRVTAGFLDPQAILASHNESLGLEGEGPSAVRLPVWSPRRHRRWLRAELERVQAQLGPGKLRRKRGPRAGP